MYGRSSIFALRDALVPLVAMQLAAVEPERERELRDQVHSVVDELKAFGWPADRINIALKEIAADAGLTPSHGVIVLSAPRTHSDAVIANLMRWSLERFYVSESGSRAIGESRS
jgi:hypothetical protein